MEQWEKTHRTPQRTPSDAEDSGPGLLESPQNPLRFKGFLKNGWYGLVEVVNDNGDLAPEDEHTC